VNQDWAEYWGFSVFKNKNPDNSAHPLNPDSKHRKGEAGLTGLFGIGKIM